MAVVHTKGEPILHAAGRAGIYMFVGMLVGFFAAFVAIVFVDTVSMLSTFWLVSDHAKLVSGLSPTALIFLTILVPSMAGLLVGLMMTYLSPTHKPHGPPDVIKAVQLGLPLPPLRAGITSSLAALVSLAGGASVGQYAPMVFIGGMVGHLGSRIGLQLPNFTMVTIGCGVAAAISAAFNAPIAGLIFAHEVILRHYSIQAFAPITIASTCGYVLSAVILDRPPLLVVKTGLVANSWEFPLFAVLGGCAALAAFMLIKAIGFAQKNAGKISWPLPMKTASAGLVVGCIALWFPEITGVGQLSLRLATVEGAFTGTDFLILMVGKICLTAFCLGMGFVGGVFSPSLVAGSALGGLFWCILTGVIDGGFAPMSFYVVAGMMALTAPVVGAPLTAIIIVFELTRNYELTIAAMLAVVFSTPLCYRLAGRSFFDLALLNNGIDLANGRDQARMAITYVHEHLTLDAPVVQRTQTTTDVKHIMAQSDWSELFVTEEDGTFYGKLTARQILTTDKEQLPIPLEDNHLVFTKTTSIRDAMLLLEGFVGDAVPVVDETNQKFLGVVTEADIIQAYLNIVQQLRDEEHAVL